MHYISFENVWKEYRMGEVVIRAVDGVTFHIEKGEFAIIVGPSGAGKTTVLNMLGGMDTCSGGVLEVDGVRVSGMTTRQLTAYRRNDIGFVFQFYNLVQNLTALENVELAAQICRHPLDAAQTLEHVGLGHRLSNFPAQLSGGEQQRVAIARALVKRPEILLLDEPLSNLDARLRLEMREEIRRIQTETGVTTVFVTHDQEEAMSITDEIILMKKGVVQQQCDPQRMYLDPANQFVASFLGSPPIDYFHFPMRDGRLWITESYSLPMNIRHDGGILTGIRPEAWGRGNDLQVQIQTVEHRGKETLVTFALAGTKTRALLDITDTVRPGDTIGLTLRTRFLYLFDEDSGIRLRQEEEK